LKLKSVMIMGLVLMGILAEGCLFPKPLLYGVEVQPTTISPNADGESDVARITYNLSRRAQLYIYFVDAEGQRHYLRKDMSRSPGSYEAWFGGAIEGRVLPDGQYTYVVEAVDEKGTGEKVEGQLVIVDADTTLPELKDFTVYPTTFTPNQDGISDRVAINYRLTKPATVEVYLLDDEGNRYPIPEKEGGLEPGAPGVHEYDYDGGVDLGASPPPDGTYTLVAEAVDAVGNRVVEKRSLTIENGGVPRAEIVSAEFAPLVVPLGKTLSFTATVENIGTVPIRTTGPAPGFTYTTSENYDTHGFHMEPGAFRFGVDYEGNSIGREYPYRWAFGDEGNLTLIDGHRCLMPGERATVVGHIRIVDKPPYDEPYFWFAILHERVRKVDDKFNPTRITVGF